MPLPIKMTEGIILRAIDFKDYDRILTVFTEKEGVVSLYVKGANRRSNPHHQITIPFTQAEFVYTIKTNTELYTCTEISVVNYHLKLRDQPIFLKTGCDLLKMIQTSQLPEKPAPQLYQLLIKCLQVLPEFPSPQILNAVFRLKLLKHEGLLTVTHCCEHCEKPLNDHYFLDAGSFCGQHATSKSVHFTANEVQLIEFLVTNRSFCNLAECLTNLNPTSHFFRKVEYLSHH